MNNKINYSTKKKSFVRKNYYVKNIRPCYTPPNKSIIFPRIIQAMRKAAHNNKPSRHILWRISERYHAISKKPLNNNRKINLHRRRAIDSIMECIAAHVNILTGKLYMTISQISDACGLTTYGKNSVPNYSRASRALLEHIEAIGAIKCERIWDNTTSSYIPNIIWVTKTFFVLIGYEYGKFISAQNEQLILKNKELLNNGKKKITLHEAKIYVKTQHIHFAFNNRVKKKFYVKQIRRAKKIALMKKYEAENIILKDIIQSYSAKELTLIGYKKLKKMVEYKYYSMCKLFNTS